MTKIEAGDFQTPDELIIKMFEILITYKFYPEAIIEPTCGKGKIIKHAISYFSPKKVLGIEINKDYVEELLTELGNTPQIEIINANIFNSFDIISKKIKDAKSVLFVGNPPWITNSKNSSIEGKNVPIKSNLKRFSGIEAITGKSNFDISEYILIKLIEKFHTHVFAFLCKTTVARKILTYVWRTKIQYKTAEIYPINTKKYFNAYCEACFFIIDFSGSINKKICNVYNNIEEKKHKTTYIYTQNKIIQEKGKTAFLGKCDYVWRNGIKHDAAKVFELNIVEGSLHNGFNEIVKIENDLLYPLVKSSDLMKEEVKIRKKIIIPQKKVGQETNYIEKLYPKTWQYLKKHSEIVLMRKSKIYKNKPPFSIFSVGEYSFKPYKIAISGLSKSFSFKLLKPIGDKPIMFDDTCNFLSFESEKEASFIYSLLTSNHVIEVLNSIIFFDSKRPITIEALNSIDLYKVAIKLKVKQEYENFLFKSKYDKSQLHLL